MGEQLRLGLYLQVFVDDVDGEVVWRGQQRLDAILTQGLHNDALLVAELLGNNALVDLLGGWVRGER
jgi:hypothetical protein